MQNCLFWAGLDAFCFPRKPWIAFWRTGASWGASTFLDVPKACEINHPRKTIQTTQTLQIIQTTQTTQTIHTIQTIQTIQTTQTIQTIQTIQSIQTIQTIQTMHSMQESWRRVRELSQTVTIQATNVANKRKHGTQKFRFHRSPFERARIENTF